MLWHMKKEVELSYLAQEAIAQDRRSPYAWAIMGNCFSLQKVCHIITVLFKLTRHRNIVILRTMQLEVMRALHWERISAIRLHWHLLSKDQVIPGTSSLVSNAVMTGVTACRASVSSSAAGGCGKDLFRKWTEVCSTDYCSDPDTRVYMHNAIMTVSASMTCHNYAPVFMCFIMQFPRRATL